MKRVLIVLTIIALGWGWLPAPQAEVAGKNFQEAKKLYEATCADCHRVNGQGLPAMFPALDGDPFVTGDANQVIDTVLQGRKGKLGQMPSWKDTLNDQQLADLITYIRQAWSNKGGAITTDMVKKRRK